MGNIEDNHKKTDTDEENGTRASAKNAIIGEVAEVPSVEKTERKKATKVAQDKSNKRHKRILLASIIGLVLIGIVVACAYFLPKVFVKSPKSVDDISTIIVENEYNVYYSLMGNYPAIFSSDIVYSNPDTTRKFFGYDDEHHGSYYIDLDGSCHKALPYNFEKTWCDIKKQYTFKELDSGVNMIISDNDKTHFAIMFSNEGSEISIIKLEDYKLYEYVIDGNDNTFANYDKYGNSCHIVINGEREFNNSECNTTRAVQMKKFAEEAENFIKDFGLTTEDIRNYYSYIKESYIAPKIIEKEFPEE